MHYLIDGYNLLFQTAWMHYHDSLEEARKRLIIELDSLASQLNLSISVVFDAPLQNEALSRGHFNALQVIFTARGQTADQFLIDWVEELLPAKNVTVVTSDKTLARHIRSFGVKVEPVTDFLVRLRKKKQHRAKPKSQRLVKKPEIKQTPVEKQVQKIDRKNLPPLSDLSAWEILFTMNHDTDE